MRVEVVHAGIRGQRLVELDLPPGTTAESAVRASGLLEEFPEIDPVASPLGIFGERIAPDHLLREGDRVEIYRALIADPKEARRARARINKQKTGKGR